MELGNQSADGKYKVNREISALSVRVLDQNGEAIGVMTTREALELSREAGLDLVEVVPQAQPPVCKITDYGKLRYELQKKKAEAKKKQKIIEIKEVKFTPSIGEHDYCVKCNNIRRFIAEGNKVKVSLRFRGRELSHQEIGLKVLNRLVADLKEIAKNDSEPQLEGRQMLLMLSPVAPKS